MKVENIVLIMGSYNNTGKIFPTVKCFWVNEKLVMEEVPEDIFIIQPSHSSWLLRSDTLLCSFAKTNYYSAIRAWNSLDKDQVATVSLQSFKHNIV